jgi:hypothetical protein
MPKERVDALMAVERLVERQMMDPSLMALHSFFLVFGGVCEVQEEGFPAGCQIVR